MQTMVSIHINGFIIEMKFGVINMLITYMKKIAKNILMKNYDLRLEHLDATSGDKQQVLQNDLIRMLSENGYNYIAPFKDNLKLQAESNCALSLLVPVYNAHMYIEECLNSLINQKTKFDYEIILINDGSTDNTKSILNKYRYEPKVKIFEQENSGISATRNHALELAKGEYIGFIDNDDYVSEDYVNKLLERAYRSNADVVKCGYADFNTKCIKDSHVSNEFSSKKGVGADILKYDGLIWGGISRRILWNKISFPVGYWYEDMITRTLLYPLCNNFEYIAETLYFKRDHDNNASKKVWKRSLKCIDQVVLAKEIYDKQVKIGIKQSKWNVFAILYEIGFMASKRIPKQYYKYSFYVSANLANSMLRAGCIKSDELNKNNRELVKSLETCNYDRYNLVMNKMKYLDYDNIVC